MEKIGFCLDQTLSLTETIQEGQTRGLHPRDSDTSIAKDTSGVAVGSSDRIGAHRKRDAFHRPAREACVDPSPRSPFEPRSDSRPDCCLFAAAPFTCFWVVSEFPGPKTVVFTIPLPNP